MQTKTKLVLAILGFLSGTYLILQGTTLGYIFIGLAGVFVALVVFDSALKEIDWFIEMIDSKDEVK